MLRTVLQINALLLEMLEEWCRDRPLFEMVLGWGKRRRLKYRRALPDDPDEEQAKEALEWVVVRKYTLAGIDTMIMMSDISNLLQDRLPHDNLAPWADH